MFQFYIKGIALDEENQMPFVILHSHDTDKILPLWIGPFEASAIIIEIEGVSPPRPLTHDLLSEFFTKHRFKLKHLQIYDYIDDNHLARITYTRGFRTYTLEIRPSDGIALAIRLKAPIFVSAKVAGTSYTDPELLAKAGNYQSEMIYLGSDSFESRLM